VAVTIQGEDFMAMVFLETHDWRLTCNANLVDTRGEEARLLPADGRLKEPRTRRSTEKDSLIHRDRAT
jgi:hypothetical protein